VDDAFAWEGRPPFLRRPDRSGSLVCLIALADGSENTLTNPRPQIRQMLYRHPREYPVGLFVGLIGITWPFADDACHYWDIEAGYTRMTPLFESTVADLNNWTLDPKILEIAPHVEGLIPIKPV
jgi:hypothetical protein